MPVNFHDLTISKDIPEGKLMDVEMESKFPYGKSDREIWKMFKNGHEGAFRHIYMSNYQHLHRFGHRITDDNELIKDNIQDLFIDLRKSKNLSDVDSIRYYLLKSLKNKLAKALKRRKKFIHFQNDYDLDDLEIEMSDELKIVNVQIHEDNKNQIQHLLNKLTKKQKMALYYFYYEELSYSEVAEIMGFSHVRSARNLIYKALNSVRVYLKIISLLLVISV